MAPITVAVAHSQRLFAEALARALEDHADLQVSGNWSVTGREIVREVAERSPDVALMDFWISDMPGPAATRAILKLSPSTRVLFLSEFVIGPVQREQARAVGALGFLGKDLSLNEVAEVIRNATTTPTPAQKVDLRAAERVRRLMTLTAREIEVLQILRGGCSASDAAEELAISPGTVKNHVHNIIKKTEVKNLMAAMIMAEDEGFISGL